MEINIKNIGSGKTFQDKCNKIIKNHIKPIIFRGECENDYVNEGDKYYDKGDLIFGDLKHKDNKTFIFDGDFEVPIIEESISQHIFMKDKNGNYIFEKDYIKYKEIDGYQREFEGYVVFDNSQNRYIIVDLSPNEFSYSTLPLISNSTNYKISDYGCYLEYEIIYDK